MFAALASLVGYQIVIQVENKWLWLFTVCDFMTLQSVT